jgi:membrane-bound ClpP family serine protease
MLIQGREVTMPDSIGTSPSQDEATPDTVPGSLSSVLVPALLSVVLLLLGTAGIGVGVGLWIHPGAGIAAAGLVLVVVGLLIGYQV